MDDETPEHPETSPRQIRARRDFSNPVKYRAEFPDMLLDYFEGAKLIEQGERLTQVLEDGQGKKKGSLKREVRAICAELPLFETFARRINCSSSLLFYWERRHPEWAEACARARDIQNAWLLQTGLSDRVQPAAWEFVAANVSRHRLRRVKSIEVTAPEPIDPRPELAKVPAAALELMKEISRALNDGLDPEDYDGFRAVLSARAERRALREIQPNECARTNDED